MFPYLNKDVKNHIQLNKIILTSGYLGCQTFIAVDYDAFLDAKDTVEVLKI